MQLGGNCNETCDLQLSLNCLFDKPREKKNYLIPYHPSAWRDHCLQDLSKTAGGLVSLGGERRFTLVIFRGPDKVPPAGCATIKSKDFIFLVKVDHQKNQMDRWKTKLIKQNKAWRMLRDLPPTCCQTQDMLPGLNSYSIWSDSGIGPSCIPLKPCRLGCRYSRARRPKRAKSLWNCSLWTLEEGLTWATYGLRRCNFNCRQLSNVVTIVTGTARLTNAEHDRTRRIRGRLYLFFGVATSTVKVVCGMCPQKKQLKNPSWDPRVCRVEETAPLLKIWSWQVKCCRAKQKCLQTKGNNFGLAFKCTNFLPLVLPLAMS